VKLSEAMLRRGANHLRLFYENNGRFWKQLSLWVNWLFDKDSNHANTCLAF
jgi:hypothetical protein